MHHNLIIKDGDTTQVVKEVLVDGIQFVDEKPRAGSTNPVTSDGVNGAINKSAENSLDDHDPDDLEISDTSKDFYDEHELGYYYQVGNKIFQCTDKTNDGDNYSTTLTKQNGIVPVLNALVDRIAALENV